jgi:membrane-bound lytic murein transglycosylase D
MRLVNTINGLLLLVLGMLISASVTSTIYRPDVTTVGQVESRDSERGNEQEKRERLILPDDGCCMYVHRQHELSVSGGSAQAHIPEESRAVGDLWEDVRAAFAMPAVDEKRIRAHINEYARHPFLLEQMLRNAEPYLFHVVQQLGQHGMPAELALLPFIESAYDPFATSPAGAAGVWQFMPATAADTGLGLDWWYDGRRDIVASTEAALGYLLQLNKTFGGDWFLTLAAYNAGSARVRRAMNRNRASGKPVEYWHLPLPEETRAYVPRLIALRTIISRPDEFNVKLPAIPASRYFGSVEVELQIELDVAARLAGVSRDEFRRLNPGYDRSLTPPGRVSTLLVPSSVENVMAERIAQLPEEKRIRSIRHRIRIGDNLSTIALQYGTTVSALRRVNRLNGSKIIAGKVLMVPVGEEKQKVADAGLAGLM